MHTKLYGSTIVSHKYAPLFCMLALGKTGEEAYVGIMTFPRDNHYWPTIAKWACNLCTFSGCLMGKTQEK